MKLTDFSVRNPLVVGGLAVALCLFGLFAYLRLGRRTAPVQTIFMTRPSSGPSNAAAHATGV